MKSLLNSIVYIAEFLIEKYISLTADDITINMNKFFSHKLNVIFVLNSFHHKLFTFETCPLMLDVSFNVFIAYIQISLQFFS